MIFKVSFFGFAKCASIDQRLFCGFINIHQQISKKIKMVVGKHLIHFCYLIRLVLYQHLNSHVAQPGIPPEISNHTRGQYDGKCLYRLRVWFEFSGGMPG